MAFASADRQWRAGVVTGLATSLPRRYKVRFDESGVEEFVTVSHIREMAQSTTPTMNSTSVIDKNSEDDDATAEEKITGVSAIDGGEGDRNRNIQNDQKQEGMEL
mmetsp:Transcript_27086/g.45510  ORF Transcript_27086/g.45510 Transcript_27086/m.45510 type:complete len:105 (+) Transcript_27086:1392-1706(+)